jgi:hypothetical protein
MIEIGMNMFDETYIEIFIFTEIIDLEVNIFIQTIYIVLDVCSNV